MIGEEPEPPYSRMAIPYHLIENIDEAGCYLRDAGDDQAKVSMDNGEEITADWVISAAGVRSNISFLEGSGIECEQGISTR